MARARTLNLNTKVEVAGLNKLSNLGSELGRAGKQAETFGQKLNGALSPKNLAAGLGLGVGIAQVTSFFGDAIQAAGEFEDSVSATGVVFGQEAIPALQAWADEAHSAFGASKQDALAAANQFAVFGKSAGLVGTQLTDFSTELVQLGGDLASMFGGQTEDAIAAVGSALRGEFEPIRAYGVLLDDATLRLQAFEMGIISTTKNALTPQQKVLAAQAAILEQTTDAQGDFARTSDGLMNTQRDLAAELENVSIEVGQEMLPIMLTFVRFLKDQGIPIMREFVGLLDFGDVKSAEGIPILGELEAALNAAVDSSFVFRDMVLGQEQDVRDAARTMGTDYMTMHWRIKRVMDDMAVDHQTAIDTIVGGLRALPADAAWSDLGQRQGEAAAAWNGLWESMGESVDAGVTDLGEGIDAMATEVGEAPGKMADALLANQFELTDATTQLVNFMDEAISPIQEKWNARAFLSSQAYKDGLASGIPSVVLKAEELAAEALAVLGNPDYFGVGQGAGYSFGAGLVDPAVLNFVSRNTARLAAAARGIFPSSEPKDPHSPFRGITKGFGFGDIFARGILSDRSTVQDAFRTLVGGGLGLGALPALTPAMAGGTHVTNIYLQWDGEPPKGRNEEEIIGNLQRLSPLVGGALIGGS